MDSGSRSRAGFDSEYQEAYGQGKHFLWGIEPEDFVRTITQRLAQTEGTPLVLDAGCGEGRHCAHLVREGCRAVGVDVSRVALGRGLALREESETAHGLVLGDCSRLPFKGGVFDSVLDVFTFEFVRRETEYIGEISRILRPGGTLFLKGHRKKSGKEPHSIDQGILLRELVDVDIGMEVVSLWVSESGRSMELEAAKPASPIRVTPTTSTGNR
jgi:SAM-dependent methyltransferase